MLTSIDGGISDHNYKYLVSSGNRPGEIKTSNPRVEIRSFVNQHEMLSRCAVFITHCGMNSVVEAILTATPMLLRPGNYEQQLTANALSRLGMGIFLENLIGKEASIEATIYEAANSEAMKTQLEAHRRKIVSARGLERAMNLIKQLL